MAVKNSFLNMTACLVCVTLVCASLLAGVYELTKEPIAVAEAAAKQKAIEKVSPAFELMQEVCEPVLMGADSVNVTYVKTMAADSTLIAYVLDAASVGFGGTLNLKVSFLPDGRIYRTTVLSHSETPGLGAKCQSDSAFIKQFDSLMVAGGAALTVSKDGGEIDAITASTITSRAYCVAVNNAVAAFKALTGIGVEEACGCGACGECETCGECGVCGGEGCCEAGDGACEACEAAKNMEGQKNE